jgi:hypothetical protein
MLSLAADNLASRPIGLASDDLVEQRENDDGGANADCPGRVTHREETTSNRDDEQDDRT